MSDAPPQSALRIVPADFEDARVLALLAEHLQGMRASSPACAVHALDLSGLRGPEIALFVAWRGDEVVGCGALKALADGTGELKSMRTAARHLRTGVASAILEHLLSIARARGYPRVSLETGSGAAFEPALELYQRRGFVRGDAFGGYEASAFNQFFHLPLRG